jgi:phosphoribosylformimino-5-aminoimidazole carboxamide ribotide isomerase
LGGSTEAAWWGSTSPFLFWGLKTGGEVTIEIIPAVDLKEGRCVRLYQGDYAQETVFSDDPTDVALKWQSLGAMRLHIVDLDGAAAGELRNLEIITEIARSVLIPTQVGGGIRDMAAVDRLLKAGVERVILGTAAVENPELVEEMCRRFGERLVVSIDARGGRVATHGWFKETELETVAFARAVAQLGVRRLIYTDVSRDGTLTEPDFTGVARLVEAINLPVIAAGGITSPVHLKILRQIGVEGAIIGRALYTGDIDLKRAMAEVNKIDSS